MKNSRLRLCEVTMKKSFHSNCLSEIEREISELEERLSVLKAAAKYHTEKISPASQENILASELTNIDSTPKRFETMGQREAATVILRESGRKAMRAAEIADAMVRGGYKTDDIAKLRNALFTAMTRASDTFFKVPGNRGLWMLKGSIPGFVDTPTADDLMIDAPTHEVSPANRNGVQEAAGIF